MQIGATFHRASAGEGVVFIYCRDGDKGLWYLRDAVRACEEFVIKWIDDGNELVSLLRLVLNRLGFVIYDTDDNKSCIPFSKC